MLFASCIDKNYDLSQIDMTLSTEANLTVPAGSTNDILLRNIMNLEDNSIMQSVPNPNGNGDILVIKQSGEAHVTPVEIGEIRVERPAEDSFEAKAKLISVDVTEATGSLDRTYRYDILPEYARMVIRGAEAKDISSDVVDIEAVECKDEVHVTIDLRTTGLPSYFTHAHLDNLCLLCPEELEIESCRLLEAGKSTPCSSIEAGRVQIIKGEDHSLHKLEGLKIVVSFKRAHKGKNFIFDPEKHTATLGGAFQIAGTYRVSDSEVRNRMGSETSGMVSETKGMGDDTKGMGDEAQNGTSTEVPEFIYLHGAMTFDKNILISRITGDVIHKIESISPINLNNLPNFLNDEEVLLDLENPMVLLKAITALPGTAETAFTLSNNIDPDTKYHTDKIQFTGSNTLNKYYLANKPETRYLPTEEADAKFIRVSNLPAIAHHVPKQIYIDSEPIWFHAEDLDVTQKYSTGISYEVFAPLQFSDSYKLVYKATERGWKINDEIKKLNVQKIVLTALATSNLDEQLEMTVEPIDVEGNTITALKVDKGIVNASAKEQPITINLQPTEGHTVNDVLNGKNGVNKIDGIRYKAVIKRQSPKAGNSNAWSSSTSLRLTHIKLTVIGTISYDAN